MLQLLILPQHYRYVSLLQSYSECATNAASSNVIAVVQT